jgi:signal transduction histidine kinase
MNKDFELIKKWQNENVYLRFFVVAVVFALLPFLKRINFIGIIAGVFILIIYNTYILISIKKNKFKNWMNHFLLFMDMLVMSIGVYSTGGIESPLYHLYYISFLDSILLLKPRQVFSTLGGIISLYSISCIKDLIQPTSWNAFATRIFFFFIIAIVSFVSASLGEKRIKAREKEIEREERLSSRLKLLWDVVSQLMPIEETEKLFERITELVHKSLGYPYVSVMIYEEERDGLVFKGGSGEWKGLTPPDFVQRVSEGLIGKCFREERTILVNDVSKDPDYIAPYLSQTKSEIDVPIRTETEVLGVLNIQSDKLNEFDEEDVILLEILGNILGIIIENASLYREIKMAYKELTEAQEKIILAEKLQLIDEISEEVAHNFQNIFSVIEGRLEFLFFKNPPDEIKKDLIEIKKAVDSGVKIVENFYRSIEESKEVFKKLEVSEIIEEALKSCENYLKSRSSIINNVSIEKIYNHKKLIYGNKELLTQALFNVILNSYEAMKEGGILKIETRDFENFVELRIKDTGVGMGEDTKKRIFQPFFSTKKQKKEFFGLYNTYRIVSFHKGELDIISEKGRGTTVIIRIPSATPS